MILVIAALLTIGVVIFVLLVREKDLPAPEPVSPVRHLEERRARIYEGLRDLQFEYRLGKLSDEDYQRTKLDLQRELAQVMSEIDRTPGTGPTPPARPAAEGVLCPHCGAKFPQPLKFCGECGKPMRNEPA